jgi:hypothetical protein
MKAPSSRSILPLSIILMSACASTPSPLAQRVTVADAEQVSTCRPVTDVRGSSSWGWLSASKATQNAKTEALEQAASLGATHVVWTSVARGSAAGKAYRCTG